MPKIADFRNMEFLSCVSFFDKMLITGSNKNTIFIYDKEVNSCSELPLFIRFGYKILASYQFKIYIILFCGIVYENLGDLKLWNIIYLNFSSLNYQNIITYTYKCNSLIIADYHNLYSFDLDKIKLEKINKN
ncbi:unnamed protein product [Blepharisma stoltei]|uniref:Uncharacterized protein n=1 Tax=Blepharisma stoltei TaxID=1481888 RepID=A0AAU9K9A7_9CILI|nr:unnamed protein product [Blepharisma stoltei]